MTGMLLITRVKTVVARIKECNEDTASKMGKG